MIVSRARALASVVVACAIACAASLALAETEEGNALPTAAPAGKVLDVQGKVLDVVGVSLGVDGVLRDLGAKVTPQEIRIELAADLRPDAVARLVGKGKVADARITTKGLGETRPKVPNEKSDGSDDPAGRQANRRVEIVIRKG